MVPQAAGEDQWGDGASIVNSLDFFFFFIRSAPSLVSTITLFFLLSPIFFLSSV